MVKKEEFSLTGIVISNKNYKDSDKSVFIFSKELGKVSFVARGARKLTSKNRSSLDLFILSQFYLLKGKAYNILLQSKIINNFIYIRKDYTNLTIALAMISFLKVVLPNDQSNNILYDLFLWCLKCLEKANNKISLLHYFLVKGISCIGFSPMLTGCSICNNVNGPFFFQFNDGIIKCINCSNDGFLIEKDLVIYYNNLLNNNFIELKKNKFKKKSFKKFNFFLEKWIEHIIDGSFNGFILIKKNNM